MNTWKVWQWPGQIRELRYDNEQLVEMLAKRAGVAGNMARRHRALELAQSVTGLKGITAALGGIDRDNPQWRALHALLQAQIAIEREALLVPNLGDEGAHFNRGRVAALEQFQDELMRAWEESRVASAA